MSEGSVPTYLLVFGLRALETGGAEVAVYGLLAALAGLRHLLVGWSCLHLAHACLKGQSERKHLPSASWDGQQNPSGLDALGFPLRPELYGLFRKV